MFAVIVDDSCVGTVDEKVNSQFVEFDWCSWWGCMFTLVGSQIAVECAFGDAVKFCDFTHRNKITVSASVAYFLNSGSEQRTLVVGQLSSTLRRAGMNSNRCRPNAATTAVDKLGLDSHLVRSESIWV